MGLFSRRRSQTDETDARDAQAPRGESLTETEDASSADSAARLAVQESGQRAGIDRGPWDAASAPEAPRIDLGALRIPAIDGMQISLDLGGPDETSTAAALALGGSSMELRAFAAPRSEGLWDDLREELGEELRTMGASYELADGPWGREILATVPVENQGTTHIRFFGVDGPRWFLRVALLGPAATDASEAEELLSVLEQVVVYRDTQARPPREVLPLHRPDRRPSREHGHAEDEDDALNIVDPGPTIAEVR